MWTVFHVPLTTYHVSKETFFLNDTNRRFQEWKQRWSVDNDAIRVVIHQSPSDDSLFPPPPSGENTLPRTCGYFFSSIILFIVTSSAQNMYYILTFLFILYYIVYKYTILGIVGYIPLVHFQTHFLWKKKKDVFNHRQANFLYQGLSLNHIMWMDNDVITAKNLYIE